jgi:hypothetical protein
VLYLSLPCLDASGGRKRPASRTFGTEAPDLARGLTNLTKTVVVVSKVDTTGEIKG